MEKFIITGFSNVNHNIRHKLGMTISEYVLMKFFGSLSEEGEVFTEKNCMEKLGLEMTAIMTGLTILLQKGYIQPMTATGMYYPYDQWWKAHKEKGMEFIEFYKPIFIENQQIDWRNSSKEATKRRVSSVLKEATIEEILYAKLRYFISKWESNSLDYVMGAEKFIGPDKFYQTKWILKKTGEEILLDYCRENYWEGMPINLKRMFAFSPPELVEISSSPIKPSYDD